MSKYELIAPIKIEQVHVNLVFNPSISIHLLTIHINKNFSEHEVLISGVIQNWWVCYLDSAEILILLSGIRFGSGKFCVKLSRSKYGGKMHHSTEQ